MQKFTDFEYLEGRLGFCWKSNGLDYKHVSATPIVAVPLKDKTGILLVDPASQEAPHNAVILNADESMRIRIRNPKETDGAICFSDAYYINEKLTLFIAFRTEQMGCVIDSHGNVEKVFESR